jgi:hypothetical protein
VPGKRKAGLSSSPAAPPRRSRAAELEGFRVGLVHRLETRRRAGRPHPEAERELVRGTAALERGNWSEAEAALTEADDLLDRDEPEPELRERPRGLVGYVPRDGDWGAPTPREEEPLANRLVLVQRLLTIRRAHGDPMDDLVSLLREAEAAYLRGEFVVARERINRVHRALDELESMSRGDERSARG